MAMELVFRKLKASDGAQHGDGGQRLSTSALWGGFLGESLVVVVRNEGSGKSFSRASWQSFAVGPSLDEWWVGAQPLLRESTLSEVKKLLRARVARNGKVTL